MVENIHVRKMVVDDLYRGVLDCLSALSGPTGLSPSQAVKYFEERERHQNILALVAIDLHTGKAVGTLTLLIEQKFLHGGGQVGHIEDVAVLPSCQGKGVGRQLVAVAIGVCKAMPAVYKAVLHCSEANRPFYEKMGFRQAQSGQMRLDIAPSSCDGLN